MGKKKTCLLFFFAENLKSKKFLSKANDNKTVFYTAKEKQTLRSHQIYRHVLGEDVKKSTLIFEEKDDTFSCFVRKTITHRYIMIGTHHTDKTEYRVLSADNPSGEFQTFLPREEKHEYTLHDGGDVFFVISNENAKNFQILTAPKEFPTDKKKWKEYIPHREDVLVEGATILKVMKF